MNVKNQYKDTGRNMISIRFTYTEHGCKSSPCAHGGDCKDTGQGYTCSCTDGYEGHDCRGEFSCYHVQLLILIFHS